MSIGIISTWRMSFEGLTKALDMLEQGQAAECAIEALIQEVENYPFYKSVGYGGLPNKNCEMQLDAAFMDGNTLQIGAVAASSEIKNPISVALDLSKYSANNFLAGSDADDYAKQNGFETTNMLTPRAKKMWKNKKEELEKGKSLKAYDGHDTVGAIVLDSKGKIVTGTSTSGLFMKTPGRVGDSPIVGSGFYADSNIGAAAATGLGEDIMKGVLTYEIVRKISEGMPVQEACDKTVYNFVKSLCKRNNVVNKNDMQISVVAMDKFGNWGVATTVEFTFCVANQNTKPEILISWPGKCNTTKVEKVSQQWLDAYEKRIHAKV